MQSTPSRPGRPTDARSTSSATAAAARRSTACLPDGKLLTYITRQAGAFRVVTQDLETGTVLPLTDSQDDESPSFAPNGRLLVYASRSGGRDVLMTTTLDGKIKARLISTGADMREPAWGPFGR
jgi:TolB protein